MFLLNYFRKEKADERENSTRESLTDSVDIEQHSTQTSESQSFVPKQLGQLNLEDTQLSLMTAREAAVKDVEKLDKDFQLLDQQLQEELPKLKTEYDRLREHTYFLDMKTTALAHEYKMLQEKFSDLSYLRKKYGCESTLQENTAVSTDLSDLKGKIPSEKAELEKMTISVNDLKRKHKEEHDQYLSMQKQKTSLQKTLRDLENPRKREEEFLQKYLSSLADKESLEKEHEEIRTRFLTLLRTAKSTTPTATQVKDLELEVQDQKKNKETLLKELHNRRLIQEQLEQLVEKYIKIRDNVEDLENENYNHLMDIRQINDDTYDLKLIENKYYDALSEEEDLLLRNAALKVEYQDKIKQMQTCLRKHCDPAEESQQCYQVKNDAEHLCPKSQYLGYPKISRRVPLTGILNTMFLDKAQRFNMFEVGIHSQNNQVPLQLQENGGIQDQEYEID